MHGDICFEHVTFRYENQKPVLMISPLPSSWYNFWVILGGTGSGKTTLMHLLNRLYDLDEGSWMAVMEAAESRLVEWISQRSKRSYLRKKCRNCFAGAVPIFRAPFRRISVLPEEKDRDAAMFEYVRSAARSACVDEAM